MGIVAPNIEALEATISVIILDPLGELGFWTQVQGLGLDSGLQAQRFKFRSWPQVQVRNHHILSQMLTYIATILSPSTSLSGSFGPLGLGLDSGFTVPGQELKLWIRVQNCAQEPEGSKAPT